MKNISFLNKFQIILLIFFILILNYTVQAKEVNFDTICKVAMNAYSLKSGLIKSSIKTVEIIPVFDNQNVSFYIFNFEKGHIIVSADDNCTPILGYGYSSNIDFGKIPPSLLYLLNDYKKEIYNIKQNKYPSSQEILALWDYYLNLNDDAPKNYSPGTFLIETRWDQTSGYQDQCPMDPQHPDYYCVVGCGGVTLAQILYYWSCRIVPQNTVTYTPLGFPAPISVNFSNQTYNWSAMSRDVPDSYNTLFLYHCAVSLSSNFGAYQTGSQPSYVDNALANNFGFNGDYADKDNYSDAQWINILRENIDNGWPIFYSGHNEDPLNLEDHGWVVDGYKSDNTFHCNWGWGASEENFDGWYLLSDLTPDESYYNDNQAACINIYPLDCTDISIINTIFNTNANYSGCSITIENSTIQNGSTVVLDADCITNIEGPFEVALGSTLEVK